LAGELDVSMPVTAAAREVLLSHIGKALSKPNTRETRENDFALLAVTMCEFLRHGAQERQQKGSDQARVRWDLESPKGAQETSGRSRG
jgi:hypothetical protein